MIKTYGTNDINWDKTIESFPIHMQDVYFTSDYYKIQEVNGDGKGVLFVYKEDEKLACYPFLVNEIKGYDLKETYFDIETAYGYGGPIVNCFDEDFLNRFEENFCDYCIKEKIVAEFIRFNPLIGNQKIFNKNIDILHNRTTVYLDLNKSIDYIWKNQISSKNRNMIRKAEKSGLTIEYTEDLVNFRRIYEETMDKVNATDYYYFSDEYYYYLEKLNNTYINVKLEDEVIATAIFMKYGEYFHYHLAGSRKEFLKFSPNNLLLWEAIKYANSNHYKIMHFGGGLTDSPEDNLFKFKKNFSKDFCEFFIGKRVHNKEVYNKLIKMWSERNNNESPKLLLQYRI